MKDYADDELDTNAFVLMVVQASLFVLVASRLPYS
jgi:hypothetical protein